MRILQILPELNVGGVETGTVDFAKYLQGKGIHSVVVSHGGDLVEELDKMGVKHYCLPVHKKNLFTALSSISKLQKIINDEKIDIVHARSRVPGWIAYFACFKTKAIFITTCHGYYSMNFFGKVMGWGKRVVVPSEVIGRHMIDAFKVPSENVRLIPRSVDLDKFDVVTRQSSKNSNPVISIIGRITPLKGHTYFLKAMAKVIRIIPYVKIWIVGDAPVKKLPYKQELLGLVRRLGLKDYVEFKGVRRDISKVLSETDVLVLSTVTQEAFGRVVLEAQAAKVPVVATRVGGVVDIVDDGKTGLLVLPKDADGMAQAVVKLLKDKKLVEQITEKAREVLESKYTLKHMSENTIKTYEDAIKNQNILVIKLSALGDVVLVTASLREIRKKFPNAKIQCLVRREYAGILQNCPYIDGVIVYDDKHKDKGLFGLIKLGLFLKSLKYDKIIDFQNNRKSHLLSGIALPRESYGYDNGKFSFLLTQKIKDSFKHMPPVNHQFRVLEMLGIDFQEETCKLELWPSEKDVGFVEDLLNSEWLGDYPYIVGINIAASGRWQTKRWPIEHMAKLCDLLSKRNIRVVVTGMEADQDIAKEMILLTKTKPVNFVGRTNVLQLAALINKCSVFLTADSAPLHFAAAMETPIVAFFGPTDPIRHMPPANIYRVICKKLECVPCYSASCENNTSACMNNISPEEVSEKIAELMELNK